MTEYNATHVSRFDGSDAMLVRERRGMVRMVNEDGHQWSDPADWWIPVDAVTDEDRERWTLECGFCQTVGCDGDCPPEGDYDWTAYDYPEYDAQTAFYEREGRPMFPNEY